MAQVTAEECGLPQMVQIAAEECGVALMAPITAVEHGDPVNCTKYCRCDFAKFPAMVKLFLRFSAGSTGQEYSRV